jgi:ADP-ribose pyrophosphatase YjhB (NUDIX family)
VSTKRIVKCPECGRQIEHYKNPIPTVDIIIELDEDIILIERKNQPHGWAIPGGFIDYGESVEQSAIREAKEETSLDVKLVHLLGVYSDPDRDSRFHTISTVFVATGSGKPCAADDAKALGFFKQDTLPKNLAFDHQKILRDYYWWKKISAGCKKNHP